MAHLQLADTRIHYQLSGDSRLPVLLLSHSLGVNLEMWQPQLAALETRFQLLRCDTRGHGQSSIPSGPVTVAQLGADVLALLDALGIAQASFCGLSMGGAIGQWLGIHAPQRLHKLILASTATRFGTPEVWNTRIDLVTREGLAPVIPGTLDRWFTPDFQQSHPEAIAHIRAQLQATSVAGYTACCAAVRDTDFRATIGSICVPTLVIAGTFDPVTPPVEAHSLVAQIPGAQRVELPAAHLCSVQAATQFNAALLGFLGS